MTIVENIYGTGAIIQLPDNRIANFSTLVADLPTFDWNKGFDIRTKLNRELSLKNQGSSGSCGGQSSAYLSEAILDSDEISARSIYNKCFVQGGGSSEGGLINTIINIGIDREATTTSYENGQPPSEIFMESADSNPSFIHGLKPVYINLDFDSIALAALQNNGLVIGVSGQNNGTWLSAYPQHPTLAPHDPGLWNHWVYVGFAGMKNGVKTIGLKNSWGNVGENGWQYITEDYLPYIWCAWSMVFTPSNKPTHLFTSQLNYGQSSKDVVYLQDILRYEGLFNNASTGYYGDLTAGAVMAFQKKYAVASVGEIASLHGKVVGPKTIKKLNELYG